MTESEARQEICRVGASLFNRGYVHATAGNISVRLDDGGYLITPTDACLGHLDPSTLARVNEDGQHVSGSRASKTISLHRKIYACAQVDGQAPRCVLHTHSTHLVALTLDRGAAVDPWDELLPPITPYFVMKVGRVPLVSYGRPGDPAVAEQVAALIRRYATDRGIALRAVMLDRLGPNVWGASPAQAMATLEELEETAKLWNLSQRRCAPLSEERIEELRQIFGATW